MAITYEWILSPLTVKPADGSLLDIVIMVDWRRTATNGAYAASCYGQVSIAPADPGTFTPFADLTKAQVQRWVEAALTPAVVTQYDVSLAADIEEQRQPKRIQRQAPWRDRPAKVR